MQSLPPSGALKWAGQHLQQVIPSHRLAAERQGVAATALLMLRSAQAIAAAQRHCPRLGDWQLRRPACVGAGPQALILCAPQAPAAALKLPFATEVAPAAAAAAAAAAAESRLLEYCQIHGF